MAEFTMPFLGADMDEGTLLEWLVAPGDLVHRGDPVAVVETAKSTIEVECFEAGTMAELLVEVLSERSGVRIEDEDTPRLTTLSGSADFLVARTR
ncbi:hypothetical protein GCM10027073_16080 [Streptomyces chlorus]|uniref:Biotin/lipoyl-containing protein n=1 Tax=Streptomyces chlorus TaxID=887452 RepID=A0ABW1DQL4_9ACTN